MRTSHGGGLISCSGQHGDDESLESFSCYGQHGADESRVSVGGLVVGSTSMTSRGHVSCWYTSLARRESCLFVRELRR